MNSIKDALPVLVAVATAVATITATLIGVSERILLSVIILASILILAVASWFKSSRTGELEEKPLYTLTTNKLIPNKEKSSLGLKTNLVFVGDEGHPEIFQSLRQKLQAIDDDLVLSDFLSSSRDKDLQRGALADVLDGADAVILVGKRSEQAQRQAHGLHQAPDQRIL